MKVHTNICAGINVYATGEYNDGMRPSNATLSCDGARIEVGEYRRILPADQIYHSWDNQTARCGVRIPNVPPSYAGNLIFNWHAYGRPYTTSTYMRWGGGDTDLGAINLRIGAQQG